MAFLQTSNESAIAALITHALVRNNPESNAIATLLHSKRRRYCCMCGGLGHWADKCPLKKELDRAYRGTHMAHTWSMIKAWAYARAAAQQAAFNAALVNL